MGINKRCFKCDLKIYNTVITTCYVSELNMYNLLAQNMLLLSIRIFLNYSFMVLCGVVFYRFHNIIIVMCQRVALGSQWENKVHHPWGPSKFYSHG